jgi:putative hydrolase of HD superfamily
VEENEARNLAKYFFELGQLNLVKQSGMWTAKVKNPLSVAEHSFRAAAIAFTLAKLEGLSEERAHKVLVKSLFHDVLEARLLDRHKISSRYLKTPKEVEHTIERDQCASLPTPLNKELLDLLTKPSTDDVILKDADYLEMAFHAREYYDVGYKDAWDWIERVEKVLKTKTARALIKQIKKTNSNVWWQGLKQDVKELEY